MTTPAVPKLRVGRIGDLVLRADGTPKTTGEFAYSSDLYAAGMLWGYTVRSPHPHARVLSVDVSQALTMPGVHAVLTHADVPGAKRYGLEFGIAFQHADDVLDDDQPALREQALARVDALCDHCMELVEPFGARAEPLRAIARWVRERAHAAAAGDKRE